MKILLSLTLLCIAISYISSSYNTIDVENTSYNEIVELAHRYCSLPPENSEKVDFCIINNGLTVAIELSTNCGQQVKFYHARHELVEFVCQNSTEQEYLQFIKCLVPAFIALNKDLPKSVPMMKKCMSKEESKGLNIEYHIYKKDSTY